MEVQRFMSKNQKDILSYTLVNINITKLTLSRNQGMLHRKVHTKMQLILAMSQLGGSSLLDWHLKCTLYQINLWVECQQVGSSLLDWHLKCTLYQINLWVECQRVGSSFLDWHLKCTLYQINLWVECQRVGSSLLDWHLKCTLYQINLWVECQRAGVPSLTDSAKVDFHIL